ncbi:MAG: molecular chaperone DnaK [Magnetococcus sp. DMHC-6]
MSQTIGIDLGTTNSCVAILEDGNPKVIPNREGSRITPSVVAFSQEGERLVGFPAKRQAITNPANTLTAIKRLIGRRYNDPLTQKDSELVCYQICEAENGDAWVAVNGERMSPAEISSIILQKMKQTAEDYLGEEVQDAVITVPAYFNDAQRQATKDAGRIAGLNVLRIINEPTAAALAYGFDVEESRTIAVYDLGGGTFDISILEVGDGVCQVKSTCGDTFLGGEDFDRCIIDHLAELFQAEQAHLGTIDLRQDKEALQRLKEAAESAKIELSSAVRSEINLPFIWADASGPKHLKCSLTRAKLEELVDHLIQRTFAPCQTALDDAKLTTAAIDEVILVGGMTRMPKIAQLVGEFYGKAPRLGVNPDEVVAVGASLQGAILDGEVKDLLLLDVTSLSLGIETKGGVFSKLIDRNTAIPCQASKVFSTVVDNQKTVTVSVAQGERQIFQGNKLLGQFDLMGIPAAPRGTPRIEVTFAIDVNGLVHVTAKDKGSNKEHSIRINASGGLTEAEIQQMVFEAEKNADHDAYALLLSEACNAADSWIYTTRKQMANRGDKIHPDLMQKIQAAIAELKSLTTKGVELEEILAKTKVLQEWSDLIFKNVDEQAKRLAPVQQDMPIVDPLALNMESNTTPANDLNEEILLSEAAMDSILETTTAAPVEEVVIEESAEELITEFQDDATDAMFEELAQFNRDNVAFLNFSIEDEVQSDHSDTYKQAVNF